MADIAHVPAADADAKIRTNLPLPAKCENGFVVTGGLGGLGLVAMAQLPAKGVRQLATTSRSGFVGPQAPARLLDAIEKVATHYAVKCSAQDSQGMADVWAFLKKPMRQLEEQEVDMDEIVEKMKTRIHGMGDAALKSALDLMMQIRMKYAKALEELKDRMNSGKGPISRTMLQEIQVDLLESDATVSEVIADISVKLNMDITYSAYEEVQASVRTLEDAVSDIGKVLPTRAAKPVDLNPDRLYKMNPMYDMGAPSFAADPEVLFAH